MTSTTSVQMINAGDTVTLCIGGRVFVTRRATLYRLPESRLFMIANKSAPEPPEGRTNPTLTTTTNASTAPPKKDPPVYFFDRDPEIFRFVLDYYRTGELHLPSSICGPFVRKELIFWGIDESLIGACCMPAYMRYDEEKRTKKTLFRDFFEDINSMKNLVKYCRGFKRWRYQMWLFLDHPSSSLASKLYDKYIEFYNKKVGEDLYRVFHIVFKNAWASILLGLMIISFMCFCLSTHEAFRRKAKRSINYNTSFICTLDKINNNRKIKKDCTTETHNALLQLDVILNIIFTLEFFMKLMLAPYKSKFLKSSICILDICILSAYWLYMSTFYFYYYHNINSQKDATALWVLNVLSMTQSLRILRIFKISKISRGLRVLMLTIKKSIPELVLLAFLLMNGMFLFSSLIYMAEYKEPNTFPDIPKAFWWSIVTLTTVGYGDSYPKGGPGYLVGSMTAICGCILTGLAIPIIGNNFNTYYMYMKNQLKEDKYLRELNKDMNHVFNANKGNAHKVKYAHFGKPNNIGGQPMFRRKFTTVECPPLASQLQGISLNSTSPNPPPTATTTAADSTVTSTSLNMASDASAYLSSTTRQSPSLGSHNKIDLGTEQKIDRQTSSSVTPNSTTQKDETTPVNDDVAPASDFTNIVSKLQQQHQSVGLLDESDTTTTADLMATSNSDLLGAINAAFVTNSFSTNHSNQAANNDEEDLYETSDVDSSNLLPRHRRQASDSSQYSHHSNSARAHKTHPLPIQHHHHLHHHRPPPSHHHHIVLSDNNIDSTFNYINDSNNSSINRREDYV